MYQWHASGSLWPGSDHLSYGHQWSMQEHMWQAPTFLNPAGWDDILCGRYTDAFADGHIKVGTHVKIRSHLMNLVLAERVWSCLSFGMRDDGVDEISQSVTS